MRDREEEEEEEREGKLDFNLEFVGLGSGSSEEWTEEALVKEVKEGALIDDEM